MAGVVPDEDSNTKLVVSAVKLEGMVIVSAFDIVLKRLIKRMNIYLLIFSLLTFTSPRYSFINYFSYRHVKQ